MLERNLGSTRRETRLRAIFLVGASAVSIVSFASPALAQDSMGSGAQAAPPQDVTTSPRDNATSPGAQKSNPGVNPTGATVTSPSTEEIVVTGLRSSLQRNLDIKRAAPGIVDAISAEDIGKFPDANVAAALQRVPGVSISRGTSSLGGLPGTTGDATAITVRGFGPAFNQTLYDGRRISTGTSNRGFDFSTVGADFVSEVDILKTPDAALSAGAIGAIVNIKFPKPFDHPGFRVAGTASGSIQDNEGKFSPAGSLLVSDTFAHDTLGILVAGTYTEHKTQTNHINNQGWEGGYYRPSQLVGGPAPTVGEKATIPGFFSQDYGIYREDTTDQRVDGRIALQWQPSNALLLTLNDNYSREKIRADQNGFSVWFNQGNLTNVTLDKNGTTTSFLQPGSPVDFQGQVNQQVLQNNQIGLNAKWDASEHLKLELDGTTSTSWLNPGNELSSLDVDIGYGGKIAPTVGLNVGGANTLPTPVGYGPNSDSTRFLDPTVIGSHVVPITSQRNRDTIREIRFQGTWSQEDTKIRFGADYVSDRIHLREYDTFANNYWQAYSGYGPASGSTSGVPIPVQFLGGSFGTSNFIPGFSGNSGLPPRILAFNPFTVLNYLQGLGNPQTKNIPGFNYNGNVTGFAGNFDLARNNGAYQDIGEDTYSGYLTIAQDVHIGHMPLHINAGVREEVTRTTSAGLASLPVQLLQQTGDLTALQVISGTVSNISTTHDYAYLLPNFDLSLEVTDQIKVRFDASRTLTRAPLNLLTPVLNVPATERVGALVATGGNPSLNPYLSDNFDLGAEWYFRRNSYFSIDGFVKQLSDFIVSGSGQQTINNVIDPTTGQKGVFTVTQQVNGPTATVRGVEVALQYVFADTGFGFQVNGTFVGTNKPYNPSDHPTNPGQTGLSGFAVTGLANSANLVAFYDKHGFQARVAVNWRDEYLDHFGQQQNNSAFGTEPTFVNASTQVDFSTSYDINKHFNVFFEALNLNDETLSTHGRFSNEILDAFRYGRRFTIGVHAKY